jgi:hypothetical protein
MRSRDEHLVWCKARAFELLEQGELQDALISMLSDLEKHPETRGTNPFLTVYAGMIITAHDFKAARRFIDGFR